MKQTRNALLLATGSILFAVAGCETPSTPQPTPPLGVDFYVQGQAQLKSGRTVEGVANLEHAVAINPNLRVAHILLGDEYRKEGQYVKALPHDQAAARLDPYNPAVHYNLGLTQHFLNQLHEAAQSYLKALELNPRDAKSNMNLGLVYMALGQNTEAVTYLETASKLDPTNALVWSNLGVALDARGDAIAAESVYRKALELDSNNIITMQNLAQNLISQKKAPEALAVMQQVLSRKDTAPIRKRYGDALALAHQTDDAIAQYDLALKMDSQYLPAKNEKGFALIRKYTDNLELDNNQRTAALALWRSSLTANPSQPRIVDAIKKWENPGLFSEQTAH